ncbi:ergothioneine biosynthesis glutamate--cysteine ligase EgtA [Actinospica sp.]|jgi:glutamate--cysteine ligase|uniref:ergothioneine biosynthesis glutamate--cysteine ligase EgtA n=1 Tax=Actinospica sp. TaxID=1872142 RepID=UPI002BC0AEB5|nr:ergothioneine biosynthesis glutamate--cysteine ligase EgtA [Actinospica sp.]HWG24866.1 ergothioneine biosynthesis glutamate--cysteine ligase EgtA [Actinospica sp.]
MEEGLTTLDADAHVRGVCFKTGPPALVGVELEWLVHDLVDPRRAVSPARVDRALEGLDAPPAFPGGSTFSREPGGQVELSSRPGPLTACLADVAADTEVLRAALAAHGLALGGWGLEPFLIRDRILDLPRYQAMEAHFDRGGPWGRRMMRCTAGLQINLDAGEEGAGAITGWRRRWELAHRLGPVLVAAFANSPIWRGRPTGWRSGRQAVWWRMDPSRTRPPAHGADPRAAWADYALDAAVLCIRSDEPQSWNAPAGLTFRGWLDGAVPGLRPPTIEDLDYHLTTLFPPIRPRGWLELRMIDAQHGDEWVVAAAVSAALFDDPAAAEAAWAATEPLCEGAALPSAHTWMRAARFGMSAPEFGKPAMACFAAAEQALSGSSEPLRNAVSAFIERYVARGRCPADDRLDALPSAPRELQEAWR